MASAEFTTLFEPIQIGSRRAKNRVMRVATTANLADANKVGPRVLAFYRTLAKGGSARSSRKPCASNPRTRSALARW